ncbi:hypothetical protein [Ectobacillus polymachus]|uniref:hypothetical protein n=1 Tax=Ectobacillus polymachus TaxID=1508806 RepID=UPI003A857AEC
MMESFLFDYGNTMITIAILSTIFLGGRWSFRLFSTLPSIYDSHRRLSFPTDVQQSYELIANVWVFDVRKQIAMSIRHKIAPDNDEDGISSLLVINKPKVTRRKSFEKTIGDVTPYIGIIFSRM